MNTAETREAMIEIDTQPTTNPLDVETALPSSIVRNWPDAMFCEEWEKRESPDGSVAFCAVGILAEISGYAWGDPEHGKSSSTEERTWGGAWCTDAVGWINAEYGISAERAAQLMRESDRHGKNAAADLLASWGMYP